MAGEPTLAIMPTGAGKSLCYQLPALELPGTTLVVSPLIALMKDQCDKLRELGVAAVQLNSAVGADEVDAAEKAIAAGAARIVFVTPERLGEPRFLERLATIRSASSSSTRRTASRSGVTTSAPPTSGSAARCRARQAAGARAHRDRHRGGDGRHPRQLGAPRSRSSASGSIGRTCATGSSRHQRDDKLQRALPLMAKSEGAGIVYAATVKAVEAVHAALRAAGVDAVRYHGKLGAGERKARQDGFMAGRARVMVATNAFGLGIDKPDLRFVVHYNMPGGLETYYQEAGRAGRDGEPADCMLLFLPSDKAVQQFFLAGRYPTKEDVADLYGALQSAAGGGDPWTLETLQEALDRPKAKLQVALRLLRHQGVVAQGRDGRLTLNRPASTPTRSRSCCCRTGTSARAIGRCSSAWCSTARPGVAGGRCCSMSSAKAEGFEAARRRDNCVRIAAAHRRGAARA